MLDGMTNNMIEAVRRPGRTKRLVSAFAVSGAALFGVAVTTTPVYAAPTPAAPLVQEWCNGNGTYTVCLFRDGWHYAAAATGPVGTVVELVGAGGVVIDWDRRDSGESQAATDWHEGGRLACVVGGPCATYLT